MNNNTSLGNLNNPRTLRQSNNNAGNQNIQPGSTSETNYFDTINNERYIPNENPVGYADTGQYNINVINDFVFQQSSDRLAPNVPTNIYIPEGEGPFSVLIVSHGGGGTNDGALSEYCENLASQGYIVLAPDHSETETNGNADLIENINPNTQSQNIFFRDSEGNKMSKTANEQARLINRNQDVIDLSEAAATILPEEMAKIGIQVDTSNITVIGHSLGSQTALMSSGATLRTREFEQESGRDFDPNLDGFYRQQNPYTNSYIAISPPGLDPDRYNAQSFSGLTGNIMYVAGTNDVSPDVENPLERLSAYATENDANESMVVIDGAQHNSYNGNQNDLFAQEVLVKSSNIFLDAINNGTDPAGLMNTLDNYESNGRNVEILTDTITLNQLNTLS